MSNAARAASRTHATHATVVDGPANDDDASEALPSCALTPARRARCQALALALAAPLVKPLPQYAPARLAWMGVVQATAWRDRDALATITLQGHVVAAGDVEELGVQIEFARDTFAERVAAKIRAGASPQAPSTSPSHMPDDALKAEMIARRATLCGALKHELPAGSPERGRVAAIRRDCSEAGLLDGNKVILRVFEDATFEAWVRALPKGEGAALDRLRALHPEWVRRCKGEGAEAPVDLAERAYALALGTFQKVLRAGRYLVEGDARRKGDYPGFQTPRATRAPKVIAAPPVPPTT